MDNEWQIEKDRFGAQRRYRMYGKIKEYEKMITVDGIEIPESELTAFHERNKAKKEAARAAEQRAAKNKQVIKTCPFKANNLLAKCTYEECALYVGGCALAMAGEPIKDTSNLKCPLTNRNCTNNCALFKTNGCTLTAFIKKESEDIKHEQI